MAKKKAPARRVRGRNSGRLTTGMEIIEGGLSIHPAPEILKGDKGEAGAAICLAGCVMGAIPFLIAGKWHRELRLYP
jgi:hypothetical protein